MKNLHQLAGALLFALVFIQNFAHAQSQKSAKPAPPPIAHENWIISPENSYLGNSYTTYPAYPKLLLKEWRIKFVCPAYRDSLIKKDTENRFIAEGSDILVTRFGGPILSNLEAQAGNQNLNTYGTYLLANAPCKGAKDNGGGINTDSLILALLARPTTVPDVNVKVDAGDVTVEGDTIANNITINNVADTTHHRAFYWQGGAMVFPQGGAGAQAGFRTKSSPVKGAGVNLIFGGSGRSMVFGVAGDGLWHFAKAGEENESGEQPFSFFAGFDASVLGGIESYTRDTVIMTPWSEVSTITDQNGTTQIVRSGTDPVTIHQNLKKAAPIQLTLLAKAGASLNDNIALYFRGGPAATVNDGQWSLKGVAGLGIAVNQFRLGVITEVKKGEKPRIGVDFIANF